MEDTNRSYRIRTEVGTNANINVNLEQDYNVFEILSLKLTQEDVYRLQSADYGVVVGRVLANSGFGIPNAKISVFISATTETRMDILKAQLYPYETTRDVGDKGIRYNLLPDQDVSECHRAVGTFPSKTFVLDNEDVIEIYEEYYKYTTRTNNSGDYMICGVPVGDQTIHMDLDLSDCGVLSQKPRDFYYKGYTVEQFENPNVFKTDKELDTLSQIFSQDQSVNVIPFWGNTDQGDSVGISRCDINVNYKFEPTCVFLGSVFSDNASNGISKKCVPTNTMGAMDELVTGEGTIEMIRKTTGGNIEEFKIKGAELINSDGVWCYQIPMNLDYIMTDEYGNLVPTDNPDKGIPTRARVRFRVSLHDNEQNTSNYFLSKVLVPNNPKTQDESDFNFGTMTKDGSFRDLFWNNVYTVKSYIPRFQRSLLVKNERFTGIKHCNYYGNNNPLPYNNIRIRLPLMFTILCAIIKAYITLVGFTNNILCRLAYIQGRLTKFLVAVNTDASRDASRDVWNRVKRMTLVVIQGELCPDLEGWYFAPVTEGTRVTGKTRKNWIQKESTSVSVDLFETTYNNIKDKNTEPKEFDDDDDVSVRAVFNDETSIDYTNSDYVPSGEEEPICLTKDINYLLSCVEMNLAQEYRVINFDFYNDWINGTIYLPRWNKFVKKKRNYLWGLIKIPLKIKGCLTSSHSGNGSVSYGWTRRYTQQCALRYTIPQDNTGATITMPLGCKANINTGNGGRTKTFQKCHKNSGFSQIKIFGKAGGIIQERLTSREQYVYYVKPCEWHARGSGSSYTKYKVNFFATDLVLLGSLKDCDSNGIPQAFKHLVGTTYDMPTNLALTNMDNEGALYGLNGETICNKPNGATNAKLGEVTSQTFSSTQQFYNGTEEGSAITYTALDDYIALTEAPGISWNYTGPGQGKKIWDGISAYQPGGLFLGISCFDSETNVKTCVNLGRACELGVALNIRREIARGVKYDAITGSTFLFNYFVPTGVISKEDILDEDFRTSFATLNHKKLIAEDIDPQTGYPIYGFKFLNPTSFDGSLNSKMILNGTTTDKWYNGTAVTTSMEVENTADIPGIDYDKDVKAHTFTRTIDAYSSDYYRFRFGLDTLTKSEIVKKYAKKTKNADTYSMPIYENSYYFYFGLHPGATALDEFNKQYFATCEKNEDVDTSGYYYQQISGTTETTVTFNMVPENPSKDYPKYIKVGDNYYELMPIEIDKGDGIIDLDLTIAETTVIGGSSSLYVFVSTNSNLSLLEFQKLIRVTWQRVTGSRTIREYKIIRKYKDNGFEVELILNGYLRPGDSFDVVIYVNDENEELTGRVETRLTCS